MAMLRLLAAHFACQLRRCAAEIPRGSRERLSGSLCFLPSQHCAGVPARFLGSGNPVRNDTSQDKIETTDAVDLDKWKYVMRSQALLEEKQPENEVQEKVDEAEGETTRGQEVDSSTLEATREMVTMWRCAGKLVPEQVTDEELQTLAELPTKSSRKRFLKYLAIKEGHKKSRKKMQAHKRAEREQNMEINKDDQAQQTSKSSFCLQLFNHSIEKSLGWNCAQAMRFGQPLVYDMSYEANMSQREMDNTVSQLMESEGLNRRAPEPFHLHFCNLKPGGGYMQVLQKRYGTEAWERLLITSTRLHYVDLFPSEKIVYLTADSPNVLRTFDHSKVYIIGALVDRSILTGLSLANAKRLNLATARLPLEFLKWENGAKNLTLDQMMHIMLTLKQTGSWQEALKFVPQRKHEGFVPLSVQTEILKRDRKIPHLRPGQTGQSAIRFAENSHSRMQRDVRPSFSKSYRDSGFTDNMREMSRRGAGEQQFVSRTRASFNAKMRDGSGTNRNKKMWWESE